MYTVQDTYAATGYQGVSFISSTVAARNCAILPASFPNNQRSTMEFDAPFCMALTFVAPCRVQVPCSFFADMPYANIDIVLRGAGGDCTAVVTIEQTQ